MKIGFGGVQTLWHEKFNQLGVYYLMDTTMFLSTVLWFDKYIFNILINLCILLIYFPYFSGIYKYWF